jgi:hypothetical protein
MRKNLSDSGLEERLSDSGLEERLLADATDFAALNQMESAHVPQEKTLNSGDVDAIKRILQTSFNQETKFEQDDANQFISAIIALNGNSEITQRQFAKMLLDFLYQDHSQVSGNTKHQASKTFKGQVMFLSVTSVPLTVSAVSSILGYNLSPDKIGALLGSQHLTAAQLKLQKEVIIVILIAVVAMMWIRMTQGMIADYKELGDWKKAERDQIVHERALKMTQAAYDAIIENKPGQANDGRKAIVLGIFSKHRAEAVIDSVGNRDTIEQKIKTFFSVLLVMGLGLVVSAVLLLPQLPAVALSLGIGSNVIIGVGILMGLVWLGSMGVALYSVIKTQKASRSDMSKAIKSLQLNTEQAKNAAIYQKPVVVWFRAIGKAFGGINGLLINSIICTGFALGGINGVLTLFFGSGAAITLAANPYLFIGLSVIFGLAGGIQSYRFTGDSIRGVWETVGRSIAAFQEDMKDEGAQKKFVDLLKKILTPKSIHLTVMMAASVGVSSALISANGVINLVSSLGIFPAVGAAPQLIYSIVFCFTLMAAGLLFGNFFHKVLKGMQATFDTENHTFAAIQSSRNQMIQMALIMSVSTALAVGLFALASPVIALGGGLGCALMLCVCAALFSKGHKMANFKKSFGLVLAFVGASTLGISTFMFMSATIASTLGVILGVTLGVMATTVLSALYYKTAVETTVTSADSELTVDADHQHQADNSDRAVTEEQRRALQKAAGQVAVRPVPAALAAVDNSPIFTTSSDEEGLAAKDPKSSGPSL